MTNIEPTYVWSHSERRHIARDVTGVTEQGSSPSLCSPYNGGVTRARKATNLIRWGQAANLTSAEAKVDAMPACKLCEKAWPKREVTR